MKTLLLFLLLCTSAFAAKTVYVSQSGSGSQDGSNPANAYPVSWLNTSGNWGAGAGQLNPGDTAELEGTITSAITVQASGTLGNVTTILFDTGAKMSAAQWGTDTGAINASNKSYITIDGGAIGTIGGYGATGTVNGIIECTDNGEGLGNQVDCAGVRLTEPKNITVKNLGIYNIFVRPAPQSNGSGYGRAVKVTDTNGNGVRDFTATNLLIHDAYSGVSMDYGPNDSNYTISYVTAYNCNWGGNCGDRGASSTLSGLVIHHCYFHDWVNWNAPADNFHHNGFYAWADSGGHMTNPTMYDNVCGPGWGSANQTAGLWNSGNADGCTYYNNLFICASGEYASNGMISPRNISGVAAVYNNTSIAGDAGKFFILYDGAGTATTLDCRNNVMVSVSGNSSANNQFLAIFFNANVTIISDYNIIYGAASQNYANSNSATGSAGYISQAAWRALGYEAHSPTYDSAAANPNFSASYVPRPSSGAIGTGVDLSATFTTDLAGYTRTVPWDIGAYKYVSPSSAIGGSITFGGSSSLH